MFWLKRLPLIAVVLLTCSYIFIFSLRNHQSVDVDLVFLILQQQPLDGVLIATFIIGALTGLASSLLLWLRLRHKYRVKLYKAERQQKMIKTSS